jgi:NitT/TauT family transport system permease protein
MTAAAVASTISIPTTTDGRGSSRRVVATVVPPLVFGVAFVAAWELLVKGFDLKPYFLPAPSAIWSAFVDNFTLIREAALVSGTNALVGLIAGLVLGVLAAFALMRFKILDELATPLAVALNAIPIVVLVSLFVNMYPATSEMPRRLMATLIVFFIVLVNVAKGLRQVQPTHLELLRSYAASPFDVLRKARIPNAVPYLFTAFKIAAPTSVITAFVAEYFGGSQNGLGNRITSNMANARNAVAWAYVLGACLVGLTFYLVAVLLEAFTTHRRGARPGGE